MGGRDYVDLQISEHQRKIRIMTIMKILQSWFFFSEDQSNIGEKMTFVRDVNDAHFLF